MTPAKNAVGQVLTLNNISVWSKKELTELAQASVAEVAENGEDTLGLLSLAAKLEHYAKAVKDAAKQHGVNDLAKYGREGVTRSGVSLKLKEVGVTYDYSDDPVWVRHTDEIARLDELLSKQETILKTLPREGRAMIDEETGEWYTAYPPVRQGRESIQATIL